MNSQLHTKSHRHGFTVVELLVVIAIIALLASLLMPALSRAKASAQGIQCLNNLKQLHLAWYLYAEDNGDQLSRNWNGPDAGTGWTSASWVGGFMTVEYSTFYYLDNTNINNLIDAKFGRIGPYVKTPLVYKCPSDKSIAVIGGKTYPRVRSVSMNPYLGGHGEDKIFRCVTKLADIIDPPPAMRYVFIDEHAVTIDDGHFFMDVRSTGANSVWLGWPASRHGGAGVLSFADGHAERKKWLDARTRATIDEHTFYDLCRQPNNPDIAWVQERTTNPKPTE